MEAEQIIDLLELANKKEFGIRVPVNDPSHLRERIHRLRRAFREQQDFRYDKLSFFISPNAESELWIVNDGTA
jgi:hypothetical protein